MSETTSTRWTVGRVAAVAVVLAIVAMWIYVFTRAEDPTDQLDDPAFADTAQPLCEAAVTPIEEAPAEDTPSARADQVERSTTELRRLVDQLAAQRPGSGQDAELVGEWLDDWETYLDDRDAYVEALRQEGDEAEFLVTPRAGRQITVAMEHFAEINRMPDCAPPTDV